MEGNLGQHRARDKAFKDTQGVSSSKARVQSSTVLCKLPSPICAAARLEKSAGNVLPSLMAWL
uniref:Uncharacterized protein n=1 Tax=Timema bartmani TaxID=61472 RepID=A0A7R9F0R9_9NEOP|nr:unnamed protein product [Timema bartmani]